MTVSMSDDCERPSPNRFAKPQAQTAENCDRLFRNDTTAFHSARISMPQICGFSMFGVKPITN